MTLFNIYLQALLVIVSFMAVLWIISAVIKNVSIADIFWGSGFVIVNAFYFYQSRDVSLRRIILLVLVTLWGLRLTIYIGWRNKGKGEDFRYKEFRIKYGEKRYWWISFFQTFLLQGILMWLISAPLLGAHYPGDIKSFGILDLFGVFLWLIGITFETGGDFQLAKFRSSPANKGKVLDTGFWRYTRHPNYFGDACVWWGFGVLSIAAGSYLPVLGSLLMTALIIKVSGVALLEKTLTVQKPQYKEYIERTSAFLPWFPKKKN